jgi:Icc-related predicted phosphoesterase
MIAVLGNHDHDEGNHDTIAAQLRTTGVHVLDGGAVTIEVGSTRVGVAGVMGGGGGFPGNLTAPGDAANEEDLLARGRQDAQRLHAVLTGMDCDLRVALTHFAPVPDTLEGEPRRLYPVLGCAALAEAIDRAAAHLAIHGHAHFGSERGQTPGGIPVRNVAHPVLRRPYAIYELPGRAPGRADS